MAEPMTAAFCKFERFTFFDFAIGSTVMFGAVPIAIGSMMTCIPLVRLICSASGKYLFSFDFAVTRVSIGIAISNTTFCPLWFTVFEPVLSLVTLNYNISSLQA